MCGICGQISFNGQPADVEPVIKMTETMKERGPDALGLHVHGGTAFGHRRLKIIDLAFPAFLLYRKGWAKSKNSQFIQHDFR